MTATIAPPADAPALKRRDPSVRLHDYATALEFYLSLPDEWVDRVVLLENSDSDLSVLHEVAARCKGRKRVELIGFQANDHPSHLGKGYGEFRMLDEGLSRSQLLRDGGPMWKVTGRLRVVNLVELIRTAPQRYACYCDLRFVPIFADRIKGNRWMDLRLVSWTMEGYDRYLRGRYPDLRVRNLSSGSVGPENWLYDRFREALTVGGDHGIVPRFRVQPVIEGVGGSHNIDYQSPRYRVKQWVRAAGRRVAPWVWL